MNKKTYLSFILVLGISFQSNAQLGKLKSMVGGKKDADKTATENDSTQNKPSGGGGGKMSGLWQKAITKVAKVAGSVSGSAFGMVATTADLNSVVAQPVYMTNLHPSEVGVIGQSFFEGWQPGGNAVMLSFTAKNSIQFNKIDGSVTIDGKPANYVSMGIYSAFLKDNNTPKRVEVTSSNGQKSSFTLNPPAHSIKVLKVNGQSGNIAVDLTKDVELDLEVSPAGNNTPVLVWLTGSSIGLKTFYEVGWFAPSSKIKIPAAMFRNMNGVSNNINFSNTYLQVSRSSVDKATNVSGVFQDIEYANMVSDGKFINVTAKPSFNKALVAEGKEKFSAGEVSYEVKKSNALFSPDFGRMKNLGVVSFAIQGRTSYYDVKENRVTNIETTKTAQFPQFPDAVWDNILDKMYQEVTAILKEEFSVNVLPLEKITTSEGYKLISPWSKKEQNTEDNFTRAYKDTKLLLGIRPISEMGGIKSGEGKIMKETGANALLKFTINLDINFEGSKAFMTPKLTFDINAPVVGQAYNTSYVSGTIIAKGIPYKKKIGPEELEQIILRKTDLLATFRKSLQEIKAKEQANSDYKVEWDAMNGTY